MGPVDGLVVGVVEGCVVGPVVGAVLGDVAHHQYNRNITIRWKRRTHRICEHKKLRNVGAIWEGVDARTRYIF